MSAEDSVRFIAVPASQLALFCGDSWCFLTQNRTFRLLLFRKLFEPLLLAVLLFVLGPKELRQISAFKNYAVIYNKIHLHHR